MNFTRLPEKTYLLVDNGSLNAASTVNLRAIAAALEKRVGHAVNPVSLLHSDRVPPEELGGIAAETFEPFVRTTLGRGAHAFAVLPLFFGPSAALTEFIPQRAAVMAQDFPDLDIRVAEPLVRLDQPQDDRVAQILTENVRSTVNESGLVAPPVVIVVDHGSPQPAVARVRDHVARQVASKLGATARSVSPASMERRPGPEYDFNEPLLEDALRRSSCGAGSGDVVVAMMFLSPGRHAGGGGDVVQICRKAEASCPGMRVHVTSLVGGHPLVLEILADRFRELAAN